MLKLFYSQLLSSFGLNIHKVPNAPFYKLVDVAAGLPSTYTGAMFGRGSIYDPMVEAKYGLPIQVSDI